MTNVKINDLADTGEVLATHVFEVENPGVSSRKVTGAKLLTFVGGGDVVNVKSYGALGDGATDDTAAIQSAINAAFGTTASPNNTNYYLNRPLYFPAGHYIITSALTLTRVQGAHIYGAGRFTTTIEQSTSGQAVFVTNGFAYSVVEHMQLRGNGARVFDMSWDNGAGTALQSNTFNNLYFYQGTIGLDIGRGGFMGSENKIVECYFEGQSTAGLKTSNFNALQNHVSSCNFSACAIGILVSSGSVPAVISTGFQGSTDYDIDILNSAHDTMNVIGCRTESLNFVRANNNPIPICIIGCSQLNATAGTFVRTDSVASRVSMFGCNSLNGDVNGVFWTMHNCIFDNTSAIAFTPFGTNNYGKVFNCSLGGTNVREQLYIYDEIAGAGNAISASWNQRFIKSVTADKTLTATQGGFLFNNTGASALVNLTLPAAAANITYTFLITDTDGIKVVANTGDTIRIAGSVSGAAGNIQSTTIGDCVTLVGQSNSSWVAVDVVNSAGWTVT